MIADFKELPPLSEFNITSGVGLGGIVTSTFGGLILFGFSSDGFSAGLKVVVDIAVGSFKKDDFSSVMEGTVIYFRT